MHWVVLQLLAEVEFTEVTGGGKLRHPSFKGSREGKGPQGAVLEVPEAAFPTKLPSAAVRASQPTATMTNQPIMQLPFPLTHPERVLYPEQGITKQALAEYSVQVAEHMLPHLEGRLLSLVRCPAGRGKACFFQKHAKRGLPEPIGTYEEGVGDEAFLHVRDSAGLVALVQLGVLEVHPWASKFDLLERPDRLIFDLDPDTALGWERIVEAALDVRDELREAGLESFVKTTGGKGLHVVAPITRHSDWDEAKAFTKAIADKLAAQRPDRYVASMSKRKRQGRIFIDYLRNARGATAVAPFSTRARVGAPVAMPVAWEELARDLRTSFDVASVPAYLANRRSEPWLGFFELRQRITLRAKRSVGLA